MGALLSALSNDDVELIDILIKYGNKPEELPVLHYAIKVHDLKAVQILIENGADFSESAAMEYAIIAHDLAIVEYLFSKGTELNSTHVNLAANLGFSEGLHFLLENDAPLPAQSGDVLFEVLKKHFPQKTEIGFVLNTFCHAYVLSEMKVGQAGLRT